MTFSPEELERRRQQCLKTKPWLKSTGATSERGKAIVSQNALRTGRYSSIEPIRALARWISRIRQWKRSGQSLRKCKMLMLKAMQRLTHIGVKYLKISAMKTF